MVVGNSFFQVCKLCSCAILLLIAPSDYIIVGAILSTRLQIILLNEVLRGDFLSPLDAHGQRDPFGDSRLVPQAVPRLALALEELLRVRAIVVRCSVEGKCWSEW